MIEKIIYTILILLVNYYFNRMLHNKNKYQKTTIFIFIILMIAVLGKFSEYVYKDAFSIKELRIASDIVASIFMSFIFLGGLYATFLFIFMQFYKEPKQEKWEFENFNTDNKLQEKSPNKQQKKLKGNIVFTSSKYSSFFIFIQKDLPIFLIVIFQLSLIWQQEVLIEMFQGVVVTPKN